MERRFGSTSFTTNSIQDDDAGYIGLELYGADLGVKSVRAKVIYWDANGQFYVETFGEVPLSVLEELISEAKKTIKL